MPLKLSRVLDAMEFPEGAGICADPLELDLWIDNVAIVADSECG